ncbi:cytochrome P450 2U1-like [Lineus longissimus]|uniref:cytochrome P450 2U1-like n=1 Tax=Lineus longissimus TaxID=88925 RepID=UPI002B4D4258
MIFELVENLQPTTVLGFLVVLCLSFLYLRRNEKLPPGPRGLPLIGSIPFIGKNLAAEALQISKEYNSDVITIRLGPILGIFLNSYDTIKDGLSSDDFTDRPDQIFFKKFICEGKGIVSTDGPEWKEQRRFALSVLRDFGMGKMAAEEKILNETQQLLTEIEKKGSEEFDIQPLLATSAANIICLIIFGQRYSYDDEEFSYYISRFQENVKLMGQGNPLTVIHWLRHLPGDLFHYKQVMRNVRHVLGFLDNHIKEHKERFDPDNIMDFLDAYILEKQRQDKRNPDNSFTDLQLVNVMGDLFLAGSDTSATTILWGLLYLITMPEIQKKVQQEIDDVIGRERTPSMMDKRHLPYTEATILEIHRVGSIGPIGAPHSNNARDVMFRGYKIPKGSFVFPNLWAVHRDPASWKYPEGFHPENFLNENGEVVLPKTWLPFSSGRRQCPGESLAKMEVFLVMTSLLQKFYFSIPEGDEKPALEGVFGMNLSPQPFHLCASLRS